MIRHFLSLISLLALALSPGFSQSQIFPGGGGSPNPSTECGAGSTTSCTVTGLSLSALDPALLQCHTPSTLVTITSFSTSGSPITAVTMNYSSAAGVVCTVNTAGATGAVGPAGAAGAIGPAGPTGPTGPAGPLGSSSTATLTGNGSTTTLTLAHDFGTVVHQTPGCLDETGGTPPYPEILGWLLTPGTNSDVITFPIPPYSGQVVVCNETSGGAGSGGLGLTVGSTTIASGTNGYVEYDNGGVLGELATTGSGNLVRATGNTATATNLASYPALCSGGQFSEGYSTGSPPTNNCATPSGSSQTFQTNTNGLSSTSTINFENSAATDGLTLTFSNPSAGNIQLGFTGSLTNAGLANSAITIGGTSVSLGGATSSLPSPGAIGGTTPSTGAFTTLSASGQFTSTVTTGTAPLVIASTTQVANLNAATAGAATNISGGSANDIPYQAAGGTTGFFAPVNNAVVVTSNTGVPSESTTLPSGLTIPGYAGLNSAETFTAVQKISLNTSALPAAQTGTIFQLGNADTTATRLELDSFGATSYLSPICWGGTNTSPSALASGAECGGFNMWGYNGSAVVGPRAAVRMYANQTWTTGSNGTYVDIATTPNGQTAEAEVIRFNNDAGITVPSTVTGGDEGAGTINAAALYQNGVKDMGSAFPAAVTGATSGGVPYFSSTTAMASSTLLAANLPVVGGGAGGGPSTVASVNNAVGVTNGSGVFSLSTSLPTGVTVPGYAALSAANTFTAVQAVSLNVTALPSPLTATVLQLANADTVNTQLELDSFGGTAHLSGACWGGTNASPTALAANTECTGLYMYGYDGSGAAVGSRASIRMYTNDAWTSSDQSTYVSIWTTANSTVTPAEVIRFYPNGSIAVPSSVTGGNKGAGSINAGALYQNGVLDMTSTFPVSVLSATNGGIPCFTSTTNMASSALLAANLPIIGGGAGTCPSTVASVNNAVGVTNGSGVFSLSTTPNIGAATGTSLIASGIIDGQAPATVTTGASCTLGTASGCAATAYSSGYTINENATAATAITYTLPTAAAGLQYCVANGYNGSAANTGTLELLTSASGQYIIFTDGTLSASGGYVISGGAARDAACVMGVDSTHWMLFPSSGSWAKH